MSLLKEHSDHLVDASGNASSSQYSLCGWLHHYQGETSVRKTTNKSVLCTQSASSSLHSWWRSSVHSLVLRHLLIYSSLGRESLCSDSLWRMTPLETAFSLCWYSVLYQSRANHRVSEGTGPRGLTFRNEIGQHTAVDFRTLLSVGGEGCLGTSTAMPWQVVWMTRFFAIEASILALWLLLQSLGVWLRLLLPKCWTKGHLLPEGYLESCPVPLFRDKSL